MKFTVAIDGPAGSGKSTIARKLSRIFRFLYVDSGACYRAICYKALNRSLDFSDERALTRLAASTQLEFKKVEEDCRTVIFMDGNDVTPYLRIPAVEVNVARVARVSGVREQIVRVLKDICRQSEGIIMDGRDIESIIMPDADVKIYLTASLYTRGRRRYQEFLARGSAIDFGEIVRQIEERDKIDRELKDYLISQALHRYDELLKEGRVVDLHTVMKQLDERDRLDKERADSPLIKTDDAIEIDSTNLSIDEVVSKISFIIKERMRNKKILTECTEIG